VVSPRIKTMKLRRLGNTSEHKSFLILDKALRQTGFSICRELQVDKVIDLDMRSLSRAEKETLRHGSFDFVIYNQESLPEFAIEFDGPWHTNDERKRDSDIRKNRLCSIAGLRLLRIGDEFTTEYEKTTLLEFIVRRFVDWRNEYEQVAEEESDILKHLQATAASEEEYERVMDPQIMWDLEHPFPASPEIAEALYSNYGVISSHMNAASYATATSQPQYLIYELCNMGSHPLGLYHYTTERTYELRSMIREAPGNFHSERIHLLAVDFRYCFNLPHVDLVNSDSAKPRFIFETVHGQDLPGISMSELADHVCDFLALDKLRVWVEQNLPSKSSL
jgi:very-short-patch-repair endonuclease